MYIPVDADIVAYNLYKKVLGPVHCNVNMSHVIHYADKYQSVTTDHVFLGHKPGDMLA